MAGRRDKDGIRPASLYQRLKLRSEARLGVLDRLQIEAFRGFGNGREFLLEGRLLESKGVSQPTDESGLLENVANTIRRFDSDEIPGARLRATFRRRRYETVTDHEGYFSFTFDGLGASRPGWHTARIELLESLVGQSGVESKGRMLLPSSDAEFMIVSDIDDTVVRTGAFRDVTGGKRDREVAATVRRIENTISLAVHAAEVGPAADGDAQRDPQSQG